MADDSIKAKSLTEQRRKLWETLNSFIGQEGGWVVSPPGEKHLRVEIPRKSALPSRLLELGYAVRAAGVGTRITPSGFMPVDVIWVTLGK